MTECNQSRFGFEACGRREVVGSFDGGTISSDGGVFLVRETDKRLNLLPRFAACFLDGRRQDLVEHSILEMLSQRLYGLALGYEDNQRSRATAQRSGFCRNELMSWCEANQVEYVFGMARNQRLRKISGTQMHQATEQWQKSGEPARVFSEFESQTKEDEEGWLGSSAARGGESGAYRWERESAFCGDHIDAPGMGRAAFVRRTVLRAKS